MATGFLWDPLVSKQGYSLVRKVICAPRDVTHDPLVKINEGLKFKIP